MDGPTFESILAWGMPLILIVVTCEFMVALIVRRRHRND